jgi:lysophospholipase L1-like esterase
MSGKVVLEEDVRFLSKQIFWAVMGLALIAFASGLSGAAAGENGALKFSFGSTNRLAGFTAASAGDRYEARVGFGFEPGAKVAESADSASSDQPFLFSVKVPEGNYTVTLSLGNDAGESTTTVKAEARRLMVENARAGKGETVTRQFSVNVRTPLIPGGDPVRLKQREKEVESVTWDEKLTLEFNGVHPSVRKIEIAPAPSVPTVFLAGDSTVCDQPLEPWNSWGQMLPRFFEPGVAVANYAESGESIKSSLGARRFEKIFKVMKPGDWLLIQFGHNDMKDRTKGALDNYRANLRKLVAQCRAKGGTPVLITSMERKAGVNGPTLAGYPEAARSVAREQDTALIDLNAMSLKLYAALGADLGRAFQDGTHHNNYGSYELARCVAAGVTANKLELARFLTPDAKVFDPSRPDAMETFKVPASREQSALKPEGN